MFELQHTIINALFEKCKTVVQHNFKLVDFKELRGNVSIAAIERILAEMKRVGIVGVDFATYACVLICTHRLPCAHEIAEYSRQGCLILLESVHAH